MPTNKKCCHDEEQNVKVQSLTLDDGRRAERHISNDNDGSEIVEIFAEEKRPLKLEKKIKREFKTVVAKEIHQTVKDGEVVLEEVRSTEPEVPLQLTSRLGVANHAKIVDGDYVRKDEMQPLITESVVAAVSALMEHMEPVKTVAPVFRAQEVVEKNVEDKKKSDLVVNIIMGVVIVGQLLFFGYYFMM
jgi:hypothetical protein